MPAAYWHKKGLDVFTINGAAIKKTASLDIASLKPARGFGKRVLVIARELLLHNRKRYPPTTYENLKKAIQLDAQDLFPLKNPATHFRIFEQASTYCLVDIWAWESEAYEKVKKAFNPTHVAPEDSLFVSEEPEVRAYEQGGLYHLIACNKDGFIGGFAVRTLDDKAFEMFLHSLGRHAGEIKKIITYDLKSFNKKSFLGGIPLTHERLNEVPPALGDIGKLDLKVFKVKRDSPVAMDVQFVMRVCLYFFIVYSLSLYAGKVRYDHAIADVSARLNALKIGQTDMAKAKKNEALSEAAGELREKRQSTIDPLLFLNSLAQAIPEGSSLSRMVLNEGAAELSFTSNDPFEVIKGLSGALCVKSVKLRGAPMKSPQNLYDFVIMLETQSCR